MSSGVFTGLLEHFNAGNKNTSFRSSAKRILVAHVLNVIKSGHPIIKNYPQAVGAISIKIVGLENNKEENDVEHTAFPIDRSNFRLPFAGEQVLVTKYPSDAIGKFIFYYLDVVTAEQYLVNNINPFLAGGPASVSSLPRTSIAPSNDILKLVGLDKEVVAKRFINRNDFEESTLNSTAVLPVKPREGETILEGRMGGVIKLTHTNTKQGVWNPTTQITNLGDSKDGDPFLIIKATKRPVPTADGNLLDFYGDDDINADLSSVYLVSSQKIPMEVDSSIKMLSWAIATKAGETVGAADENSAVLQSFFPGEVYDPTKTPDVITSNINMGSGGGMSGASLGLTGAAALAYDLILSHEGNINEAMWDISNWRIGHGSSTLTLVNGTVVKLDDNKSKRPVAVDPNTGALTFEDIGDTVVKDGQKHGKGIIWKSTMTDGFVERPLITEADADRDLARRVRDEFVTDVIKQCGNDLTTWLGNGGIAALADIKYNYGNITKNGALNAAQNAYKAQDKNILANYVRSMSPVNDRRAKEADYILMQ
jgi:hypothetical protein